MTKRQSDTLGLMLDALACASGCSREIHEARDAILAFVDRELTAAKRHAARRGARAAIQRNVDDAL